MNLKCGIVGLPNVGKSTLFNAVTKTANAESQNYPFCTIEPNIGKIIVPDDRLQKMAAIANSAKIIPNAIEIVDIAGLVKGASKGEGLGNQFLGNIKSVNTIIHMVRCFEEKDITHVEETVDPIRDIEIIETELILADLQSIDNKLEKGKKRNTAAEQSSLEKMKKFIEQGKMLSEMEMDEDCINSSKELQLLTIKPMMYVANIDDISHQDDNQHLQQLKKYLSEKNAILVTIAARLESEISDLSEDEKKTFLQDIGMEQSGLDNIVQNAFKQLNLLTFFTVGEQETRAWTTKVGSLAPQAAGVIHTDFEKGFIKAETVSYDDFIEHQGVNGCKANGKARIEGKEYVVQEGDIMLFRFNV